MSKHQISERKPGTDWIVAGGEMGQLIRSMDWSRTPLGARESWPQSLRTTINICLASDLPICIIWGPGLVQIYNDGYRVICGGKHPRSMGQNFPECWREAWPVIGAAHDSALAGNTAFLENQHIFLERHGYTEECFFTLSFSPILDEAGRMAGLFHPVIEMTSKMLGDRRTRTLRDMATRTGHAKSIEEAFTLTTETLAGYELDLPFVLIYRLDEVKKVGRLIAATGLSAGMTAAPELVDLAAPGNSSWPLAEVSLAGASVQVDNVEQRFGKICSGPFPEVIKAAVLLPIMPPGAERPIAVVVAGISPRLSANEMYRGFYDLLASAVTTTVANARAYEGERKRAEALAEIDRAKTTFFSNVSHEFRTPLTLMLGPTEDLLALPPDSLTPDVRRQLDVIHRNSLRLQKLVNTLLDFSRLEAGRIQASYAPTDLAALTGDLTSVFRSAIEKAGLQLIVDCPPLAEPVHVDCDMWEKVVLNLLSNAFKFTLAGEIHVTQKDIGDAVQLSVRDTGAGIAAAELPRIFERFHRVEGAQSRTHEGTGIGLALVQGLVKLHGGTVALESVLGKGSTFTVTLPTGTAHLPEDRIEVRSALASTALTASHHVEEAMRWSPDESAGVAPENSFTSGASQDGAPETRALPRILLADDNADMRDYVRRLLSERYLVQAVADGEAALIAARENPPDLILSDVMMPRLDGYGLLRELRADPRTRSIPVVLLSARAGEESRVAGMDSGADDYLVKPFSAQELLARVGAHLKLARVRRVAYAALRESEERYRTLFNSIDEGFCIIEMIFDENKKPLDYRFLEINPAFEKQTGLADPKGKRMRELAPQHEQHWFDIYGKVALTGEPIRYENQAAALHRWYDVYAFRVEIPDSHRVGIVFNDITERRQSETNLRESEARFRQIANTMPQIAWAARPDGYIDYYNERWYEFTGFSRHEVGPSSWEPILHPDDLQRCWDTYFGCIRSGTPYRIEYRFKDRASGGYRWFLGQALPVRDERGEITRWFGTCTDIDDQKRAEEKLEETVTERTAKLQETIAELESYSYSISHDMRAPLRAIQSFVQILEEECRDKVGTRGREYIRRIVTGADRMDRLIQDILTYSRVARADIALENIDLAALLNGILEGYPQFQAPKVEITVAFPLPRVRGNVAALTQCLSNLIGNAVKFVAPGVVPHVKISAVARDKRVRVSIQDNGIGIDPEMHGKIFGIFYRLSRDSEGTGIGLAVVRRAAERMGGAILVESELGKGSTFHLELNGASWE